VRVVVTEIGWDGSMRRRALDTCGLTEAGRWETLIEQVLAFPPPYRAAPGSPVYVIHAADRAVLVGEQDLTGSLLDLVMTILAAGGPSIAAQQACRQAAPSTLPGPDSGRAATHARGTVAPERPRCGTPKRARAAPPAGDPTARPQRARLADAQ
jgi:hypothetical protein